MKTPTLDAYEKDILESIGSGEWKSSKKLVKEKLQFERHAKFTRSKLQSISIDVYEEDLNGLKKISSEIGIPYQNIISALIHNYSLGKIKLNV
jgi:predicted DNA binding CopG/RHH family protein